MDDDNLWIGTYTGGVNVLNLQTGTFKTYSAYQDNPASLDGTSSYAIFKDRKERIWVTSMSGVNLYNREKDNFTRIKDLDALTIDIDQDTKGNLWFSTQGKDYLNTIQKNRYGRTIYMTIKIRTHWQTTK